MGIVHFAGLGRSPGAITTSLSYLKNNPSMWEKDFGKVLEKLIIFTSPEIVDNKNNKKNNSYEVTLNEYGTRNVKKEIKEKNPIKIIEEFIREEFKDFKNPIELYVYTLDVNDFKDCFEIITKVLMKYHGVDKVGKHIWANITGGTNVLNAAMMQVTYLSGVIPRFYYTFISNVRKDGKYLRPFSNNPKEFSFKYYYSIKTQFDNRFYYILKQLIEKKAITPNKAIKTKDLLSMLKQNATVDFTKMDEESLIRNYINVMEGISQNRRDKTVFLNSDGQEMYRLLNDPLFKRIIQKESNTEQNIDDPEIAYKAKIN